MKICLRQQICQKNEILGKKNMNKFSLKQQNFNKTKYSIP